MSDLYKYGVAIHLYKPLIKRGVVDFAVGADFTPAAGDVKISKDGGAAANVTNLPSAIVMGNTAMWDYSLTATEMQAAKVRITVSDSATKAVEDTMFEIDTYGNASAQHQIDLADSVRAGLTALPNAAAAAAGGLMVLGVNATATSFTAGFTVSNAGGDALVLTSSGSNGSGLNASGNGTGAGIKGTGGATGNGVQAVGGATSGSAIKATGTAGNAIALELAGQGSAAGLSATGGATGPGATFVGGATSGSGISAAATTSGDGFTVTGAGTTKHGINATGGATSSDGIRATGGGTGSGATFTSGGGATGNGITVTATSTNGAGMVVSGSGTGDGIKAIGGSTQGAGVFALGGGTGSGLQAYSGTGATGTGAAFFSQATSGAALRMVNGGASPVVDIAAASTGKGISITTAGADGISVTPTGGHALVLTANGASKHGLVSTGGTSGTSDGASFVAGSGGVDFRANQTGNLIGTVSTLTTYTGNTVQTGDAFARLGAPAGASVSVDVAAVKTDTALIKTATNTGVAPGAASGLAIVGSAMALSAGERNSVADALLDRTDAVETGLTPRGSLRLQSSAASGVLSGAATTTVTINNAVQNSKARITATVDASGNRSAIVTDVT